jgi:hypothetical protein
MGFLSKTLGGVFVPWGTINPRWAHTTAFGPSYVRHAFGECIRRNRHLMRVAFPFVDLLEVGEFNIGPEEGGEKIYLAFDDIRKWIFVYHAMEDIGILFSDTALDELLPGENFLAADEQFYEVCQDWAIKDNKTHAAAIREWLNLRNNGAQRL